MAMLTIIRIAVNFHITNVRRKNMNNNEFNIQRKEDTFFTTLMFCIPDQSLTTCLSSVLEDVIKKYSLPEQSIIDIHFFKTEQKEQKFISVVIKYCKFNPYELKALDALKQIRFVLKFMGYADKDIKSIKYKKYWSNSNDLVWVAVVSDPNYNFDPDEAYSERSYKMGICNAIKEVLGFLVLVDFV